MVFYFLLLNFYWKIGSHKGKDTRWLQETIQMWSNEGLCMRTEN